MSNMRPMGQGFEFYVNDHEKPAAPPAHLTEHKRSGLRATFYYGIWERAGYDNEVFGHPRNSQLVSSAGENIFYCPTIRQEPMTVPGGPQTIDS